ncbi:MAG: hypothetical protein QNJ46_21440 [Leptolyngbyaceae cyanobacterium MO_188.B28]|nr:hypothetical protein [Leptolyngbyaceae cyanobacterium MO_188.B28]
MQMMFEIADIHILIEHDPSPAINFEQCLSYTATYYGRKLSTSGTFGNEIEMIPVRPNPYIIWLRDQPCESGFHPYIYGREAQIHWPIHSNTEKFECQLKLIFQEAKRRLIYMMSISPDWSNAYNSVKAQEAFSRRNNLAENFMPNPLKTNEKSNQAKEFNYQ